MVISFNDTGLNVTYIQVKTSKYKTPWIENPDDQKCDKNDRAAEAKNQLFRDIIRKSELFPEEAFQGKIVFHALAAFPLMENFDGIPTKDKNFIITKEDLSDQKKLLQKLQLRKSKNPITDEQKRLYLKVFSRYVSLFSTIPMKNPAESLAQGIKTLDHGIKSMDTVLISQIEGVEENENTFLEKSLKDKLLEDEITQKVQDAIKNAKYRKKFQLEYPGIPIYMLSSLKDDHKHLFELESPADYDEQITKDIITALDAKKIDKENFKKKYPNIILEKISRMPKDCKSEHLLKEKSGSTYPVFGRANILTTLKHFDRRLNHQGIRPIIEELEKEKIVFFDRSQDDNFSLFPVNKENE